VVYRLRRPWPNPQGATHLILEPLDFLRRLAALVSFPYSHQVRYHGVFSNRSRFRGMLPSPPAPPPGVELGGSASAPVTGAARELGPRAGTVAGGEVGPVRSAASSRRRLPWAQLLRRVLQVDDEMVYKLNMDGSCRVGDRPSSESACGIAPPLLSSLPLRLRVRTAPIETPRQFADL